MGIMSPDNRCRPGFTVAIQTCHLTPGDKFYKKVYSFNSCIHFKICALESRALFIHRVPQLELPLLFWPFVSSSCTLTVSVSYIPPMTGPRMLLRWLLMRSGILSYCEGDIQHPTRPRVPTRFASFSSPAPPSSSRLYPHPPWVLRPGDMLPASTLLWMKRPFKIH